MLQKNRSLPTTQLKSGGLLVDGDGPLRRIIDGNLRKRIADELGYNCPEIVKSGLSDQEERTLARALNLARRQLDQAARRAIIADQLRENPGTVEQLGRQAAWGPPRHGGRRPLLAGGNLSD
jgi:hypothetical protein